MKTWLAIDIGASSGRHIVGWQENGKICRKDLEGAPSLPDSAYPDLALPFALSAIVLPVFAENRLSVNITWEGVPASL